MPQSEALTQLRELIANTGKSAVSALFPDEFEVYMMTLELVDSKGKIADYLCFPVMPSDMTKSETEITNVQKTAGGVVAMTTDGFTPQDITINGNFGRAFKVLIGRDTLIDFKAFAKSVKNFTKQGVKREFNPILKNGYGCTKILQNLVNKSTKLDGSNKPYKLFFHNPTLGESYLVTKSNLTLKQNKDTNNMMWAYTLSFRIIADANKLVGDKVGKSSLTKTLAFGVLNKGANTLANGVGEMLRKDASSPPVAGNIEKVINVFGGNLSI